MPTVTTVYACLKVEAAVVDTKAEPEVVKGMKDKKAKIAEAGEVCSS